MFPNAHLVRYFDLYSFRINFNFQYYLLSFYVVMKVNQTLVADCRFLLVLGGKNEEKEDDNKEGEAGVDLCPSV